VLAEFFVAKSGSKRPIENPRRIWEGIDKMDVRKVRLEGAIWIHLT
jgi:hypothetical protein